MTNKVFKAEELNLNTTEQTGDDPLALLVCIDWKRTKGRKAARRRENSFIR